MASSAASRPVHDRFHPGALWPDSSGVHINAHGGGILFDRGVYYWFGEHKIPGEAGNAAHVGVGVYSSSDLYNWKNEGVAFSVSDDPTSPVARGCVIERPKVVRHPSTRQYVMWFHLERPGAGYASALAGVAVADAVTGPYTLVRAFRPNAGHWPANVADDDRRPLAPEDRASIESLRLTGGFVPNYPKNLIYRRDFEGGQMSRDQTLFVDPADGQAYHVRASEDNGTLHVSCLREEDWLDTSGRYVRRLPGRFHEAPALFAHGGRYWMLSSGCTGWKPNPARLSVAESPLGPWRELGNPCRGTPEQVAATFGAQSTYVLPVEGKPGAFIFLADRWRPENAIDGRYVWLPLQFDPDGTPFLEWFDEWDLGFWSGRSPG